MDGMTCSGARCVASDATATTVRDLFALSGGADLEAIEAGLAARNGFDPANPRGTFPVTETVPGLALSARTLFDGADFALFDGDRLPFAGRPGGECREAVGASSRFAAPSLRYGPSGDPPPSPRQRAAMAVSRAFGHWPIASGSFVGHCALVFPFPFPATLKGSPEREREEGLLRLRVVAVRRVVGLVRRGSEEAVATSRPALDPSLAHKPVQCRGDSRVAYPGAFSDLGLHEWGFGCREHLRDPLFGAVRLRRSLVRSCPPELQRWSFAVIGKLDLDIVEAGCGAMLGGHDDLPVAPAQVEIAVAPGMQLAAAAQRLAGAAGATLASVVDEQHSGPEAALQVAQEAEDGSDFRNRVLVDAMQADQGIEDEEARSDPFDGLQQPLPVEAMIEAERGHVDDGDVEGLERRRRRPGRCP